MLNSIFKRKEDEDRVRDEGRLPPGQSLTQKFPVLHYGPVPGFNPVTWDAAHEDRDGHPLRNPLEQI